jgi:hypothetical protein
MATCCVLFSIFAMDRFYAAVRSHEAGMEHGVVVGVGGKGKPSPAAALINDADDGAAQPLLGNAGMHLG